MRHSGAIALGRQEKWRPKNRPFMEAFNIQLGSARQSRTLQRLLRSFDSGPAAGSRYQNAYQTSGIRRNRTAY